MDKKELLKTLKRTRLGVYGSKEKHFEIKNSKVYVSFRSSNLKKANEVSEALKRFYDMPEYVCGGKQVGGYFAGQYSHNKTLIKDLQI